MAKAILVNRTDFGKLRTDLKADARKIEDFIISRFQWIGEECVRVARENGAYRDRTGNLRSSIGYMVMKDGSPLRQGGFLSVSSSRGYQGNGAKGRAEGQAFLKRLGKELPDGLVLVICAGMEYASYVEAIHHLDVLTSAELKMESLVHLLLDGLIKK